jgi:hypothetical protein
MTAATSTAPARFLQKVTTQVHKYLHQTESAAQDGRSGVPLLARDLWEQYIGELTMKDPAQGQRPSEKPRQCLYGKMSAKRRANQTRRIFLISSELTVLMNVAHAKESRQPAETAEEILVQLHVTFDDAYTRDELGSFGSSVSIIEHLGDWNAQL